MGHTFAPSGGLEPPTYGLEVRCSIQLSYEGLGFCHPEERPIRAGEGNRTLTTSLEGWSSTIELHPRISCNCKRLVGLVGLEPTTSCSQSRHATKLRHSPNDTRVIAGDPSRKSTFSVTVDP